MAVVDVLRRQLGGGLQSGHGVLHAVVLFKTRLEALENVDRFLHSRLDHIHFLKAPRQRSVFFKNTAVFSERCCADAFELAGAERRFEQIRSVQCAARSRTRANQRVNFVNEQNAVGLVFKRLQNALQTLLKITPVFGTGQQGAHIKRINLRLSQNFRHIFLRDAPGQALSDCGLAHARLTHQQWVVFAAAAQDLNDTLNFIMPPNQRVNFSVFGKLVQVLGVLLEWRLLFVLFRTAFFVFSRAFAGLGRLGGVALFNAVGNKVNDVKSRHALLVEVIHRVRVFFTKNSDQHIRASDFFFAVAGRLHVHDGALNHALKTECGLRINIFSARDLRGVVFDEIA